MSNEIETEANRKTMQPEKNNTTEEALTPPTINRPNQEHKRKENQQINENKKQVPNPYKTKADNENGRDKTEKNNKQDVPTLTSNN